ncbi:MAG: inositol monophosphatase [Holosporaceae bacterium]|nr:inositol monophosphatase [Holosporaceae bacterium]
MALLGELVGMVSVKSATLTVMTKAVIKASRWLLRDFSELENLQVSIKSNRAFVTSADLKADKILRDELLRARDRFSLLSEESVGVIGQDSSCRWIVDPLDGTVNYMHGFPHWAISVALEMDGEIVAAVTFDPVKNEMFCAEKGCGAYMNDKKIRVSGKRFSNELLIGIRTPCHAVDFSHKISSISSSIRKTGSMTLDMAYVACGRFDALLSFQNPNLWDVAAGMLLIREAGGILATATGKSTSDHRELAIASNINLMPTLAQLLA